MARRQESKLTALQVTRLKEPGTYADGGNLYLQISQHGGKSWLFRYMLNGRVGTMGLGPLDTVTLPRLALGHVNSDRYCLKAKTL